MGCAREFFHRSSRAHYLQARRRHRRRDGHRQAGRSAARGGNGKRRTGRDSIRSLIQDMLKYLIIVSLLSLTKPISAATAPDLEDRTRAIAAELRCVVCQNLSVADSPSEMAQQMRGIVRAQLQAGKTPQEIKNYFVSKYGEWVLLAPATTGFSLVLWVLPFVALAIGLALGIWLL